MDGVLSRDPDMIEMAGHLQDFKFTMAGRSSGRRCGCRHPILSILIPQVFSQ